jgi:Flp pilus assembly protein TadG
MKYGPFTERGQALVLITLAAIGIFAVVGLAIDGSAKFSDQRHAQNAADTAALTGALSLVNGETTEISGVPIWKNNARNRAGENGYSGDLVHSTVEIYLCSEVASSCGPYAGNSQYVQVIINSYVNTFFARVIGINQTHNRVQAVTFASKRGPIYDGNLIVALNPNPCSGGGADGNVVLGTSGGSTGVINLTGGGVFVNSGGSGCGMNLTGCPVVNVTDGTIGSAGNGNVHLENNSGSCSATVTAPPPSYNNPPYPFPPEMLQEPSECISPAGTYSSNGATLTTTVQPGKYFLFPPRGTPSKPVYDKVVMAPGIYCIEDMVKLNDQHLILTGTDVTIFIRSGFKFDIQGGTIQLDAPSTGPYAGYLIIVDSNFAGSPLNCSISGNGSNSYIGTIFAPYCNLTINGTSAPTSYSAQVIAYTVKINGSAAVNLSYNESVNAQNEPKIGLMR